MTGAIRIVFPIIAMVVLIAQPGAGQGAIGVEHVETRIPASCSGNVTLVGGFPSVEETWFANFGTVELFHWLENGTIDEERPHSYDFLCRSKPAIVGRGWGGLFRHVVLASDCCEILLCSYDGATETGCTGEFKANETYGRNGLFKGHSSNRPLAPGALTYKHEAGWVLLNVGEGSTRAYQGQDPDPVAVPALRLDIPIAYAFVDERGDDGVKQAPAGVVAWLLVALVAFVLCRRR